MLSLNLLPYLIAAFQPLYALIQLLLPWISIALKSYIRISATVASGVVIDILLVQKAPTSFL